MAKSSKKMTFEEAVALLQGDVLDLSLRQLEEAKSIVASVDADHPVLKKAEEEVKAFEEEKRREAEFARIYKRNTERLEALSSGDTYDSFIESKENEDMKALVENTTMMDGRRVLEEKEKHDAMEQVYEGAKLTVNAYMSLNSRNAEKTDEKLKEDYQNNVKTVFFADFAAIALASKMDKPKKAEQQIGSKAYHEFIARQSEKAVQAFSDLLRKGKKITVKVDNVIAATADTADKLEDHLKALQQKLHSRAVQHLADAKEIYTKSVADLNKRLTRFEKRAKALWANRYVIARNVKRQLKNGLKDNKLKIIGNVGASAGMGLWMSAAAVSGGTLAAPVIAYAAYHAAGSWVWPVVQEARRINRVRKELGREKLSFKKQMLLAWRNKTRGKSKRGYLVSGVANTVLATAGAAWLSNALRAGSSAKGLAQIAAESVASTRRAVTMGRIGVTTGAQLTDAGVIYGTSFMEKDAVKRKEQQHAALATAGSAVVSAGVSSVFQVLGSRMHLPFGNRDVEAVHETARGIKQDLANGATAEQILEVDPASENTGEISSIATNEAAQDFAAAGASAGKFPTEYSESTGLTPNQFKTLRDTMEGTLKSANGEEITLDRAYSNLETSMDYFDGMTKEQVLYNYNRLYAFMRRAVPTGDGTLRETPSGIRYLESKFSKLDLELSNDEMARLVQFAQNNSYASKSELTQGLQDFFPDGLSAKQQASILTIIASNRRFASTDEYNEAMEALTEWITCGKPLNKGQAVAILFLFENTDTMLRGGTNNTVMTGMKLDCPKDEGEWRIIPKEVPVDEVVVRPEQPTIDPLSPITDRLSAPGVASLAPRPVAEAPRVRTVEHVSINSWEQLTGQEDPSWQEEAFKTSGSDSELELDQELKNRVATEYFSRSDDSNDARSVEIASVNNLDQLTGQEPANWQKEAFKTSGSDSKLERSEQKLERREATEKYYHRNRSYEDR